VVDTEVSAHAKDVAPAPQDKDVGAEMNFEYVPLAVFIPQRKRWCRGEMLRISYNLWMTTQLGIKMYITMNQWLSSGQNILVLGDEPGCLSQMLLGQRGHV
jgi:hypothetical protein